MTSPAPDPAEPSTRLTGERIDPPSHGTVLQVLRGFVDFHRQTLLTKASGLSAEQLRTRHEPSAITLGGMLAHVAFVEDYWVQYVFLGHDPTEPFASAPWEEDEDWEWTWGARSEPDSVRALLVQTWERSDAAFDAVVADAADEAEALDTWSVRDRGDEGKVTLAYLLIHLVEEYARHNGHADLLREALDGTTGE